MTKPIFEVGFDNGEIDFGVFGTIQELTPKQMQEFRAMIVVGIGIAEDMWRRHMETLPENQAYESLTTKEHHAS